MARNLFVENGLWLPRAGGHIRSLALVGWAAQTCYIEAYERSASEACWCRLRLRSSVIEEGIGPDESGLAASAGQRNRMVRRVAACFSAGRLFWLSMFLVHAAALPALWSASGGEADFAVRLSLWSRLVALTASAGFFALKIIDVSWLRLKPGWRSGVAAVVVIALVHVGVVDRAVSGDLQYDSVHLGVVFFVGAWWQAETIKRLLGLALASLTPVRGRRPLRFGLRLGRAWEAAFQPLELVCIPSSIGPRSPPLV